MRCTVVSETAEPMYALVGAGMIAGGRMFSAMQGNCCSKIVCWGHHVFADIGMT